MSASAETRVEDVSLSAIALQAVSGYLKSDKGVAAIDAQVEKTVQGAIRSTLGEYSDFGKQVKEAVARSLAIHGDIDLPSYNHTVLQLIQVYVEKTTRDSIQSQVAERMKFLLEPAPAEILLSEVIEQYRKYLQQRSEAGCVCDSDQNFYLRLRRDEPYFFEVSLSEDAPTKHSSPDIVFGVSFCRDKTRPNETPKGEIYSLRFNDAKEVERELFVGPLYGFERMLFQLKAAKSKVVIDVENESEVDTYYGRGHD